jgi:hypothetical protein
MSGAVITSVTFCNKNRKVSVRGATDAADAVICSVKSLHTQRINATRLRALYDTTAMDTRITLRQNDGY